MSSLRLIYFIRFGIFSTLRVLIKGRQQNLHLQNLKKMFHPKYIIFRIKKIEGNSVDQNEAAHYELPHLDLNCFQI